MIDIMEISRGIGALLAIALGTFVFRLGTDKGWYLKTTPQKDGTVIVPKEAETFKKGWLSEDYTCSFVKRGAYAIVWFFVVWLISLMAVYGGSTLVDKNPQFEIPCLVLIAIITLIGISKPVLIISELIEQWIFCNFIILWLSKLQKEKPMLIRQSKDGRHYKGHPKER